MTHGTISTYNNKKCRCVKCRAANAAYSRAYNPRRYAEGWCQACGEPRKGTSWLCEYHKWLANEHRQKRKQAA